MDKVKRHRYVRCAVTAALMELLREKDLDEITVSEIAARAQVGRVSFYRNYKTKEDVVREHVQAIVRAWAEGDLAPAAQPDAMIAGLFEHVACHRELYMLLRERGLFHLFRDALRRVIARDEEELPNVAAYATAFVTYGLYGWIEEWLARGMVESPQEIYEILKAQALMSS